MIDKINSKINSKICKKRFRFCTKYAIIKEIMVK